jgi:hypothetical protein
MRRILGIAALMTGLIGATTVPAAAQGWGYSDYDRPWGAGVGVSVGGVGVGVGAPAYGAYAADPGYAYSAAPCSCGTAASYGYSRSNVRGYRPSVYAAGSSYGYEPGYTYSYTSSRPAYGYESTYAYGDRGYGVRGSRFAARGEFREGVGARDTVRSANVTRERSAVRGTSRDQTVGVRDRSGSVRAATMRDSNAMMRGPSTDGRGGNVGSAPQAGGELRTGTTGRTGAPSRMNDQSGAERR